VASRPPAFEASLEILIQERARQRKTTLRAITIRRILYWLAAMVVLLIVGSVIGLIWADTNNVAGAFAGVTNIVSVVGIVILLIALAVKRRRRPS
jgi:membrane protein YdbS with pleckstrin-like domain